MIRYTINNTEHGKVVQRDATTDTSMYDEVMAVLMILQTAYKEAESLDDTQGDSFVKALKQAVNNNAFWNHAKAKATINLS